MEALKKNLDKILIGVSLLFGVLAIIMLVAAGISPKAGGTDGYTMAEITFGLKKTMTVAPGVQAEVEIFKFAVGNLFTYIFIVAGIACAVVALLGKGGKIMNCVAAGLLVVGGVLYFCAGKLLVLAIPSSGGLTIGIGSILGGIFSILAAVAVVVPVFIKK